MDTKRVLFLSDLDGTWLSKDPANRKALDEGVLQLRDEFRSRGVELEFGYVTARPPARVAHEKLPTPDYTITHNGGFIHHGEAGATDAEGKFEMHPPLRQWQQLNEATGFQASVALAGLQHLLALPQYENLQMQTVGHVVGNLAADACPSVASLCFREESVALTPEERKDANGNGRPDLFEKEHFQTPTQVRNLLDDLARDLEKQGVQFRFSPAYPFAGKPYVMFDASSPIADKGRAVEFLRDLEGVEPEHVIIAGDGGNDIAMMRSTDGTDDGRRAIVVGGEKALYDAAGKLRHTIARPPEEDCSLGVLRGLRQHLEEIAREA